jgi:hypothetical protein
VSKKRRRRPPPQRPSPTPPPTPPAERGRRSASPVRASTRGAGRPASATGDQRSPQIDQPTVPVSVARGLTVVGTSPALLASAFAAVLLLWLGFTAFGVGLGARPGVMAVFLSLPPVHSFIDLIFIQSWRRSAWILIPFGAALLLLRALFSTYWITAMARVLGGTGGDRPDAAETRSDEDGPVRPSMIREVLERFWVVMVLELAFILIPLVGLGILASLLGPQLGYLALIAWLLGGIHFLVFAEVIAVVDRASFADAIRWSISAARLPGRTHALFSLGYLMLVILLLVGAPASAVVRATPSLSVWIYVLVVSFLHVGALGAVVHRWVAIRVPFLAAPQPQRARRARSSVSLRGMLGR